MGATHFKMKRLEHVATEMALARARLQHDARDGDPRCAGTGQGDEGVKGLVPRTDCRSPIISL